jgi:hypothetical protein
MELASLTEQLALTESNLFPFLIASKNADRFLCPK